MGHNSIESAESYFSLPNAGLVLIMLNFRLGPAEILTVLKDPTPKVLLVHAAYMECVNALKCEFCGIFRTYRSGGRQASGLAQ